MPFKKGQKKPTGSGRVKGTPNKRTLYGQENIQQLLSDYMNSGLMESDFACLDPKDRLAIAERFTSYIVPKRQAVAADVNIDTHNETIVDFLANLAQENE